MAKKKSAGEGKSPKPKASEGSAPKTSKPAPAAAPDGRMSWLDDESGGPLIHAYTERLNTFLEAMADGRVETAELEAQEQRLTQALKAVESKLDDALHAQVTELLCELTAYNIMHTVSALTSAAPVTKFRG